MAVALHAVGRAGPLLTAGAGPIGLLVLLAARRAGAETITITDILDAPLALARRIGADVTVNVATDADALAGMAKEADGFAAFDLAKQRDQHSKV